jgi:hypothetical protein
MKSLRIALLVAMTAVAGCASPEATRSRGGGPGADIGNRTQDVKMHAGSQPFWKTPDRIEGDHPSLESSRQAQELSRSSKRSGQRR